MIEEKVLKQQKRFFEAGVLNDRQWFVVLEVARLLEPAKHNEDE